MSENIVDNIIKLKVLSNNDSNISSKYHVDNFYETLPRVFSEILYKLEYKTDEEYICCATGVE